MNVRRIAAGGLALLDGILGASLGFSLATPGSALLWLSVVLLVLSLLCLYGVRLAFLAAAVVSVVIPGVATLAASLTTAPLLGLLVLSLASMVANVVAYRSTSHLSEQANPMNLPVFG